jgi:hypothetical protein
LKLESDIFAASKVSIKKGIKRFTEMTNKWKGHEKELRNTVSSLRIVNLDQIKAFAGSQDLIKLKKEKNLEKFFKGQARESAAKIPEPPKVHDDRVKIVFSVQKNDYDLVAETLFPDEQDASPESVGIKCFMNQLSRAKLR